MRREQDPAPGPKLSRLTAGKGGKWVKTQCFAPFWGVGRERGAAAAKPRGDGSRSARGLGSGGSELFCCVFFFLIYFAYFCLFSSSLSALKSDKFDPPPSPRPLQLSKKAPKIPLFNRKKKNATSVRPALTQDLPWVRLGVLLRLCFASLKKKKNQKTTTKKPKKQKPSGRYLHQHFCFKA